MRDPDIRKALTTYLSALHADQPETLFRHELGLCSGERRIDLAVLNGSITGYEIKSDVDTLMRLSGQADVYNQVLDYATVVTTARYIEKATALLPSWWGVILAQSLDREVALTEVRPMTRNVEHSPMALAQLLWRDEALNELRCRNAARGFAKKARWYVWERLIEVVPLDELRDVVRERLKAREDWQGGQPM